MIKEALFKNQAKIKKNIDDCFNKTIDITKYLTNLIIRSFGKKFRIKKEAKIIYFRRNYRRLGLIDLRIFQQNKTLDIEIDSSNKMNSLDKLNHCKKILGHDVLWIKWGRQISEKAMKKIKEYKIDYLYIPTGAHRRERNK